MTTFPITYIEIIIWLILISQEHTNPWSWTKFLQKFLGTFFGIWLSIFTFNGEYWLDDISGSFTLTQFADNFQLPLALIIMGVSIMLIFMLVLSLIEQDWKKEGEPQ